MGIPERGRWYITELGPVGKPGDPFFRQASSEASKQNRRRPRRGRERALSRWAFHGCASCPVSFSSLGTGYRGKPMGLPRILKRFDYIIRISQVQALLGTGALSRLFPARSAVFLKNVTFVIFFIIAPLPSETPSKHRVFHIIHRVINIVMLTAD